jgi:hypothetical protein
MATIKEQEDLMATLKFTPRTYKISMWGYGGEKIMGTVDRKVYDYFRHRRLDLSDYAWNYDYAEEQNIPEEFQPFPPGSWYEGDNIAHINGVSRDAGTLQIEDENGNTVLERSLDACDGGDDSPELCCDDEIWIDSQPPGTVVFLGSSNEKGTFFEGEIDLKAPFDIEKLCLHYEEFDGEDIIGYVTYDGEDIDNNGGSTDGKSSDFAFYIAGSQAATGKWEYYKDHDSIEYPTTEWFPKKVTPVYVGNYEIETTGKKSYKYQALWTGSRWVSAWISEDEYETAEELKIKQWRGIPFDPDAVEEWDPAAELDKIIVEHKEVLEEIKADPRGWPF